MLLAKVLEAYGGKLPEGGFVLFANTGKEHLSTYTFIERFSSHFDVDIRWLEYSPTDVYKVVEPHQASKNGQPFKALVDKKRYLPNPLTRFCTSHLKVKPMNAWMAANVGSEFTSVIGLRHDEPKRVSRLRSDTSRDIALPLDDAKITKTDVLRFWASMPFDLALPNNDEAFGNCDLCFLKNMAAIQRVIQHDPSSADWWASCEENVGAKFRSDRPKYSDILRYVTIFGREYQTHNDGPSLPCDCTE